jgi:hypothetical protein
LPDSIPFMTRGQPEIPGEHEYARAAEAFQRSFGPLSAQTPTKGVLENAS